MKKIITIGREFGSGGREFGRKLAEKLGYAYYDREIIEHISKDSHLSEDYVQEILEQSPILTFPISIGQSFMPMLDPLTEMNNEIYNEQTEFLRKLGEKGNCVIVGRCADYVLRDMNCLRFFVYASLEHKMDRCRKHEIHDAKLTDKELMKKIKHVDHNRKRYYEYYTNEDWGAPINYDLMINTTHQKIDDVVRMAARLIEES